MDHHPGHEFSPPSLASRGDGETRIGSGMLNGTEQPFSRWSTGPIRLRKTQGRPVAWLRLIISEPGFDSQPCKIPILDPDGNKIVVDKNGERIFNRDGKPRQSGDQKKGWTLNTRKEDPREYGNRLYEDIAARPHWYYQRREISRLANDLTEFQVELWQRARMLRESELCNRWPRDDRSCMIFNRPCEYFKLCTNGYDPYSGLIPEGFEIVDNVHQELSQEGE